MRGHRQARADRHTHDGRDEEGRPDVDDRGSGRGDRATLIDCSGLVVYAQERRQMIVFIIQNLPAPIFNWTKL
jgi:hypothetical protein